MRLFPKTTHFFLNTWTLGYEDILTAVACAFGSKVFKSLYLWLKLMYVQIHADRYKHSLFTKFDQEPLLRSISTRDSSITRFHACERFDRCEYCDVPEHKPGSLSTKGNRVVYVNPVSTMNREMWKSYQTNTKNRLVAREDVTCLVSTFISFVGNILTFTAGPTCATFPSTRTAGPCIHVQAQDYRTEHFGPNSG